MTFICPPLGADTIGVSDKKAKLLTFLYLYHALLNKVTLDARHRRYKCRKMTIFCLFSPGVYVFSENKTVHSGKAYFIASSNTDCIVSAHSTRPWAQSIEKCHTLILRIDTKESQVYYGQGLDP